MLLAILAGLIATGGSGCQKGPPTGMVAGTVEFEGQPYGDAAIVFMSMKTGNGGTTNLAADGGFKLPKPIPVGGYRVYLAPKVVTDDAGGDQPQPVTVDKSIPKKYWSESSSDVNVEVKPGENTVTVELRR